MASGPKAMATLLKPRTEPAARSAGTGAPPAAGARAPSADDARAAGPDAAGPDAAGPDAVLRARTREPFDAAAFLAPVPFEPRPYKPPRVQDEAAIYREAARRVPIWPWAIMVTASAWLVLAVSELWLQIIAALPSGAAVWWVSTIPRRRAAVRAQVAEALEAAHAEDLAEARDAHEANERQRRAIWEDEEAWRARLRAMLAEEQTHGPADSVQRDEDLTRLLVRALEQQEWPMRIRLQAVVESGRRCRISFSLAAVPGWPSDSPHTTDWAACPAVALRLAWEAFHVLPTLEKVEATAPAPAEVVDVSTGDASPTARRTGPAETVAILDLRASRNEFQRLGLDALSASEALERLGGRFEQDDAGRPRALAGGGGSGGGGSGNGGSGDER